MYHMLRQSIYPQETFGESFLITAYISRRQIHTRCSKLYIFSDLSRLDVPELHRHISVLSGIVIKRVHIIYSNTKVIIIYIYPESRYAVVFLNIRIGQSPYKTYRLSQRQICIYSLVQTFYI